LDPSSLSGLNPLCESAHPPPSLSEKLLGESHPPSVRGLSWYPLCFGGWGGTCLSRWNDLLTPFNSPLSSSILICTVRLLLHRSDASEFSSCFNCFQPSQLSAWRRSNGLVTFTLPPFPLKPNCLLAKSLFSHLDFHNLVPSGKSIDKDVRFFFAHASIPSIVFPPPRISLDSVSHTAPPY